MSKIRGVLVGVGVATCLKMQSQIRIRGVGVGAGISHRHTVSGVLLAVGEIEELTSTRDHSKLNRAKQHNRPVTNQSPRLCFTAILSFNLLPLPPIYNISIYLIVYTKKQKALCQ
ncbi:MAG: hypothetical protein P1S60_09065 [Anaerolineae bacterium]|nr:hypothetical protein [Anaerolineae bacterium]